MIYQIESISDFKQIQINVGPIGFPKEIKSVQHEYNADNHPVYDLHKAKRVFNLTSQESRPNQAYL